MHARCPGHQGRATRVEAWGIKRISPTVEVPLPAWGRAGRGRVQGPGSNMGVKGVEALWVWLGVEICHGGWGLDGWGLEVRV